MTKLTALLGALFLISAITAGCSSTTAPTAGTPYGTTAAKATEATTSAEATKAAEGPTITISGMAFGAPLTVAPGATITIVNEDTVEHSVTSEPTGTFDTDIDGGGQKTFTAPTKPGNYPFKCKYHPNMKGTLTVT